MAELTLISSYETGVGGDLSITFSSLPQHFDNLIIYNSLRIDNLNNSYINMYFNDDRSPVYNWFEHYQGGGVNNDVDATYLSMGYATHGNIEASTFSVNVINIVNYSSTSIKKLCYSHAHEPANTTSSQQLGNFYGTYDWTSAISSITLYPSNGKFVRYSSVQIYGI